MKNKTLFISGAQAVVRIAELFKVKFVFAYPGTSELILCDEFLKQPGINLVNGRGDKESAFMAAGGCLVRPNNAIAILHGARGLTNAAGAIADARRNEIGTVFLVGLPSTSSMPFLPPHGENNLIKNIGGFVKNYREISISINSKDSFLSQKKKASLFLNQIYECFASAQNLPIGPSIIGLPQDILEKQWVCPDAFKDIEMPVNETLIRKEILNKNIKKIIKAKTPVILVDDFAFKNLKLKKWLKIFAQKINAPIFQVYYRRGPMLFEKLNWKANPYFVGPYDADNINHLQLMNSADLLLTIEDRNIYPRVVGDLPDCAKIAITSNPAMTLKNNYLKRGDSLIFGDVADMLAEMVSRMKNIKVKNNWSDIKNKYHLLNSCSDAPCVNFKFLRQVIPSEIGKFLHKIDNPILIDDSQMFGGVLSQNYNKFPMDIRVFGGHGAFIGGGISLATGFAISNPARHVVCTIGDQSFVNGVQGLVSACEQHARITFIVCNNGQSVSLLKQARSQDTKAFKYGQDHFLQNVPGMKYSAVASQIGVKSFLVNGRGDSDPLMLTKKLRNVLKRCAQIIQPSLIELVVPSDPAAWHDIWAVKGNEKRI